MEKKGKEVVSPHTHEDPIDITSPSLDLLVQDDIPSLTEEHVTITSCVLHIKIAHFNSVTSVIITSVVSVASCLQVSHIDHKCHKCHKHHTYILPMSCL
jgi:hypothetical protein